VEIGSVATLVYVLCAATSLACAVLLARAYHRSGLRLMFWSAACFGGFFLNNILLIVDLRMVPETDLSVIRSLPVLGGLALLIFGLVWDTER
jgi:hypothetical protein